MKRAVAGLFFLSGFSSLIYQIVWMRQLSLFFGSDVYSAAVTLSAFMAGLSLGSLLAARWADRLARPLVWYGVLEVGIGLCALSFTTALHLFLGLHHEMYQSFDAAPWRYQLFRVSVAAVTLLLPTTMMGATLPLIVTRFVSEDADLGRFSGFFYSVNTLGALAGVLCVSFALLPALGVRATTLVACAINAVVGSATVLVGWWMPGRAREPGPTAPWRGGSSAARAALLAIGVSGLAALALEVVWTRIMVQSFSATVYSFAIMLCCFLFGIFYGSQVASAVIDKADAPLRVFGFLELALGVSVGVLGVVTHLAPSLFGKLLWTLAGITRGAFGPSTVIAAFLVSALLITVPTVLMGATFPAAVKASAADATRAAEITGRVYAANTAGGVAGALLGGFVLIPLFGGRNSLAVLGLIFLANGLFLLWKSDGSRALATRAVAIPLAAGCAAITGILLLPRQIVINFNQQQTTRPNVVYHGEGISHTIDIVRNQANDIIMMVDGNIEADTSYLQRRHFILKAHVPLLLHPRPKDVAVVGLGLGITLSATAHHPGIEAIQVIELTPEMLKAHAHLEDVTRGVLHSPNIAVRIDDGRNFLAMSDRRFDIITADPIHPRISGVGYLYTTEYYKSVKSRLRPQGIVCQWMPMYAISKESFDVAFRTFASVFPDASFWYVRGHGLFVAGRDRFRIDYPELAHRFSDAGVTADLASIRIESPTALLAHMLMGPRDIERYLASQPRALVNTDDNAYLEYHTPAEFLQPTEAILSGLLPFARLDDSVIAGLPDGERAGLRELWNARRAEILPEIRRTDFRSPLIGVRP